MERRASIFKWEDTCFKIKNEETHIAKLKMERHRIKILKLGNTYFKI